jgi:hypothetical protein
MKGDTKRYTFAQSESSDWYIVPESMGQQLYDYELETGETPAWAIYVDSPCSISFTKWEDDQ